jgi:hypothetical protein
MHKSKLAGFIIDCQTTDLDRAADFWGGALGMPVRALPPGEGEIYKQLEDAEHGLHIEVQAVTHPSRIHLDRPPASVSVWSAQRRRISTPRPRHGARRCFVTNMRQI